ncbi:MAG: uridine kinase [Lachnospiraceae bacterium]|nr:uridine kinase [Lachnospiraceae bacterium]
MSEANESRNPVIIGIAGGTGSGKSTFTNRIKDLYGDRVSVLYHDSYYRAQDDLPLEERMKVNYDHPDSLETELLLEHLKALKEGKAIESPVYDYTQHNRAKETVTVEPRDVILLEGILVLADAKLRKLLDIKIFVDTDADERILRRVRRDTLERGRSIQSIIDQYLATVKPMHNKYVEPSKAYADLVVNGGLNDVALDLVATKVAKILKLD